MLRLQFDNSSAHSSNWATYIYGLQGKAVDSQSFINLRIWTYAATMQWWDVSIEYVE